MISTSRKFMAGAASVLLFAGLVAACAAPSSTQTSSGAESAATTDPAEQPADPAEPAPGAVADNPFGLVEDSTIDAVVFDGGYKTDYVDYAGEVLKQKFPNVTVNVEAVTEIAAEMQPRFVGGNPPDLLDNQGAQAIPVSVILDQLTPLDDFWTTPNYDGIPIVDAVADGIKTTGSYNGKFIQVPYVMTLWAFYYSQSLFDENGWTPPTTWDEALTLCDQAKAKDLYLFTWGKEAASYWAYMVLDSAGKSGGAQVVEDIANLKEGAWENDTVKAVLGKFKEVVDKGCFIPGGAGTQFTQAQAQWSNDKKALLYYTGSWIENEMKDATADNFQMTAWPVMTLDKNPALPFKAVDAGADEKFVIPADGANSAGAKELLRAMLSKDAAANFAKTRLAPTIVKDTVPADGFGSTALATTSQLIADSGADTFSWGFSDFINYYSLNTDVLVLWNSFMSGDSSVDDLIAGMEGLAKGALASGAEHVEYSY